MVEMSEREYENLKKGASDNRLIQRIIVMAAVFLLVAIAGLSYGCPQYGVWKAELDGKAELAQAEYAKQVLVQEANANLEAERLNAEAEVVRAQGAADARNVEGLGMTSEEYIQYLWVKKLSLAESSVIYLPSEGGLPVLTLEAGE